VNKIAKLNIFFSFSTFLGISDVECSVVLAWSDCSGLKPSELLDYFTYSAVVDF